MSTRCWSCALGLLILLTCSGLALSDDWNNAYQLGSDSTTDLSQQWTASGDWVQQKHAIDVNSEQEALLRLNMPITASVIQVQFDFTYTSEDFTEAGVAIGLGGGGRRAAAQFIFHGGEQSNAQLIVPARAPFVVDSIKFKTGETYQIIADVNGMTVQLFVNGKPIAQRQLMTPLASGQIALFASKGNVSFGNLLIRTKQISDAQLAERAREQARESALKAQFEPGYVPPTWDPSKLVFKQRSARTRLKQVPLKLQSDFATPGAYPLSVGVPIEDRQMFRPEQFRLTDAQGKTIPCQITPTALWDQEDAIKWIMVDANVQVTDPSKPLDLILEYGRSVDSSDVDTPMTLTQSDAAITVDTGKLKVTFSKSTGTLIDAASLDGKPVMVPDATRGGFFVDSQNVTYRTSGKDDDYQLVAEVVGPMHTILRASGWYVSDARQKVCRYVTRIHLYKDQAIIRMEHTWIVTIDTDQFWFNDLGLNFPMSLGADGQAVVSLSDDKLKESLTQPVAGNAVSLTQNGLAQATVMQAGKPLKQMQRTGGWVSLLGSNAGTTLTVRDMAMQFPNQLDVTDKGITFHAWQTLDDKQLNFRHDGITKLWGQDTWKRFNDNVTSQGALESRVSNGMGFARTHELTLTFHEPKEDAAQTAGALGQVGPIASIDPEWVKETDVLPVIMPTYDAQRFANYESDIKQKFDEYVNVATHLEPMVGFWDYGRGCPGGLALEPGRSGDDQRWTYSGVNASDDMSYGNPQVPWLLYLRSGDRKYLRRARATTTHVMDTRIMHWYAKSLGREIGQSYKHTGTWVFDGADSGWTGDIWASFLATAYHVTGYQRSLDVLGEIANGFVNTKRPAHNVETVTYLGAIARYYQTCFDQKLRNTLVQTSPIYMQYQLETGFWPSNDQAYEYALLEMLKLPRPDQSWENTAMNFARGAIGPMRFHTHWSMAAGVQAWAYARKQADPRFGVNAQEALSNGIPKLIGYANLAPLRSSLIWMGLSDVPGIAEVVQPKVLTYARPQESLFYIKHEQGTETHVELHCKQGEISITDLEGKPIAPALLRSQRSIGIYEITLGESMPETQFKIEVKPPVMYESKGDSLGRSLPWRPGENEMLVVMHGPTLFVQDISNGKLTHSPGKQVWFFVPKRTDKFTINAADPWPLINDLILQKPDSGIVKAEGSTIEVTPESEQTGELWMLQAKQPYFQIGQTAFARGAIAPGYLKLTGIPPFVSPSKDCYFRPIAATTQNDELRTESAPIAFPRGRFRRGVRLQGIASYLQLPTGKPLGNASEREYFNATRGTIEMFVCLDRRTIAGGYSGKLLDIPFAQSKIAMMDFVPSASWEGIIRSGNAQTRQLPLTDNSCSPSIDAGKWYHLAIQWDVNDNGKVMRRVYLDGYPYAYGDASGKYDPIDFWPQAMLPGTPGDWIYLGDNGTNKDGTAAMVIDELRISDIPRYPFMPGPPKVGGRKAFNPPEDIFTVDAHTCGLYHFEGNADGTDRHGKTIVGKWMSKVEKK
jgi:hypothetical protein